MGTFLNALGFLLVISVSVSSLPQPSNITYPIDIKTGLRYFWFEKDNGERIQAFIEGGPDPIIQATEDDVQFYLYTKNNPSIADELMLTTSSIINSNFDKNAPVKIICHGFMSDYQSNINVEMKNAYLRLNNFVNIIIINWEKLAAAPWYDTAAGNTNPTGRYAAQFVDFLVNNGYTTYGNVHFSGHSLGAHVGGHVGTNTANKISRLSGLDPALPLFGEKPNSERIDPSDADFVDVIHTSGGTLAFIEDRGHVDFFPNNGKPYQPGCGIDIIATCSHSRAYEFYAESIWHTNGFPSYKCNSWEDYDSGRCSYDQKTFMGEPADRSARGRYYLRTNQNPPFGQE